MLTIKIKPGTPYEMDDNDNPTFEQWMKRVDQVLINYCGVGTDDLPDCTYRDWYDERLRPIRAANKALRNARDF